MSPLGSAGIPRVATPEPVGGSSSKPFENESLKKWIKNERGGSKTAKTGPPMEKNDKHSPIR